MRSLTEKWGKNELPEKVRNPILMFLSYFTGPMPTMIWVAILIELSKAILIGEGWCVHVRAAGGTQGHVHARARAARAARAPPLALSP